MKNAFVSFMTAAMLALSATACSGFAWRSPLMTTAPSASLTSAVPADRARVVFVQVAAGRYPTRSMVRIADEQGSVLGDSLPTTWFAVDVAPGKHEFFGWQLSRQSPGERTCACFMHKCDFVGAMRADLLPGRVYYVRVAVRQDVAPCGDYLCPLPETADLQRLSPEIAAWPPALLDRLQPMVALSPRVDGINESRGDNFASTFLCVGHARMQEGRYWDATTSTLAPQDGRAAPGGMTVPGRS
jgi:hypothetical protein